jgi:hypothetical protein
MRRRLTAEITATTPPASAVAAIPSRWTERAALTLLVASLLGGCGDKKDDIEQIPPPASEGRATRDQINTKIGIGLAVDAKAPSNTRWEHVWVVDDATAVVVGRASDEALALVTKDKGRSFQAYRANVESWHSWGAGPAGAVALLSGAFREGSGGSARRPVDAATIRLTSTVNDLGEPAPFFGKEDPAKDVKLESSFARPAVLTREIASIVAERGRLQHLVYGVPGGTSQPEPVKLPPGRFVAAPYGQPPQLLSLAGASLQVRPWPRPGEEVSPKGQPIAGLAANATMIDDLSNGPGCDTLAWSFQRIGKSPAANMVGVSPDRSVAFRLPPTTGESFGCSPEAVVVESKSADKQPQIVRCTLDGKCETPQNAAFEAWPDEPEKRFWMAPTDKGLVAFMAARKGARWGVYLASSMDGGKTFDLPRPVGEGEAERGSIEVGALIAFPDRLVLLVSADVTGTSRRGWYVLQSSDAGATWGVP